MTSDVSIYGGPKMNESYESPYDLFRHYSDWSGEYYKNRETAVGI